LQVQAREVVFGRGCRSALEVVDLHGAGAELQAIEEATGGLELRVHAQHEVATEERLLPAPLLSQVERLLEGAEDALLGIGGEGGVTGIIHRQIGSGAPPGNSWLGMKAAPILTNSPRPHNLRPCYTLASVPRLECVPNVSEGRRPEVVARLIAALSVPGVQLLDASSDPDHNRSVFTL